MASTKPGHSTWTAALNADGAARVLAALEADMPHAVAIDPLHVPEIEGYVIDGRLGAGGGGDVYLAMRIGSDQPVAIKVLTQRLGENPDAKRAWRELDLLAQLRLASIPRLLDHGLHDGRMYLVTEFIDGVSLLEYCERDKPSRAQRVELLARIADAVHSVHEFGVIHRDIKPGNILIDRQGQPVLIDLGIASLLSQSVTETLTRDGAPIGTPAFMAPEQARGDKKSVSTRSDVYSLGATAFLVLTSHTPHPMDDTLHETIRRVAQDPPRDPRELDPSLPKPLAAVLAKACAPNPDQRYASAAAFAADLRRWVQGEAVDAVHPSFWQCFAKRLARHPIAATTSVCAAIALCTVALTIFSVWWLNRVPNSIEIDPVNQAFVRLLSRSGNELHRWDGGATGSVRFALLTTRPVSLGGERIAIMGFSQLAQLRYRDQICVFDINNPHEPLWKSGSAFPEFDVPPPISMVKTRSVSTTWMKLYDIFPESPGDEILTAHQTDGFSGLSLRVYGLDGRVLYEIWHDGYVSDGHWMPEAGLLIFSGWNSEGLWADRGQPTPARRANPAVVFAIRPELGEHRREWIYTSGGFGTFQPVWYKCFWPPHAMSDFETTIEVRQPWGAPGESAAQSSSPSNQELFFCCLVSHLQDAKLGLLIDQDGRIVDRIPFDQYRVHAAQLPDPNEFALVELPPLRRTED